MSNKEMLMSMGGVKPRSIAANADVLKALRHLKENAGVSLVDSYRDSTSWYRKYSDGWIEQGYWFGGNRAQRVNFKLAFSDTNYSFVASPNIQKQSTATTYMTFDSAYGDSSKYEGWVVLCGR